MVSLVLLFNIRLLDDSLADNIGLASYCSAYLLECSFIQLANRDLPSIRSLQLLMVKKIFGWQDKTIITVMEDAENKPSREKFYMV